MKSFIIGIIVIYCIYSFVIKEKSPKTILTKLGTFLTSSLNFLNKKINSISKTKNKRKPFFNNKSTITEIKLITLITPLMTIIFLDHGIGIYLFVTLMLLIPTLAHTIYVDKRYGKTY
jgi:hypothetical protein